ncbi:MAG: hypothetical protein KF708_13195 [Pirellulales bacterium]|nr:hypothetical protein [Pirellulales bacterium]
MSSPQPRKGPWFARFLIAVFTVLFGCLTYWLLSFVMQDIGTWPGPDWDALERQMIDPALQKQAEELTQQIEKTRREIEAQRERQATLRDSTTNSQTTMNQLLEFQKLRLEKDVKPSPEEQQALAESQTRFLANQQQYQELNSDIARQSEALRDLEDAQRANNAALDDARRPVYEAFNEQFAAHRLKIGLTKLAVLLPLLIVAVVLFLKLRESIYVPLVYALGIAVAVRVFWDMNQYFPARFFKYVLILTFLAIVTKVLITLVRAKAYPRRDWLLKQFRESYEAFFCPVCEYPIRRGPLKYLFWTRRSIKKRLEAASGAAEPETPYTCPACSTRLFEECGNCHGIRHSLLPTCEKCGATREPEAIASAGA